MPIKSKGNVIGDYLSAGGYNTNCTINHPNSVDSPKGNDVIKIGKMDRQKNVRFIKKCYR